jgi:hypothetical protein
METPDRVLDEIRYWLDRRSPGMALCLFEEARHEARNNGRRMKELDRFVSENFSDETVREVQARSGEDLDKVTRWMAYSTLDDDLWFMTIDALRCACALESMAARRPGLDRGEPLLDVALTQLPEASHGFRETSYLKYLGRAGPILPQRIADFLDARRDSHDDA